MRKNKFVAGPLTVPVERIERHIYLIRGQKVMLDSDLAEMYQVGTKNVNLAVRRNGNRFPEDFMLQLTKQEAESLRFQNATSRLHRVWRRHSLFRPEGRRGTQSAIGRAIGFVHRNPAKKG